MKTRYLLPLLALVLLTLAFPALAEDAEDISAQCSCTASTQASRLPRIFDRDYGTAYVSDKQKTPSIEVTSKASPMYGVYVCFGGKLTPWRVEASRGGKWVTVYESEGLFAHEYAPLPDGEKTVRIKAVPEKNAVLSISELFVFGPGETPAFVQQWQPTPEKADLMVIAAHPDDEILFFGGAIPTYAAEKQLNVVVVYMTCGNMEDLVKNNRACQRRSELLNGLWEMGLRAYPVVNDFWDKYAKKLDTAYDAWGKTATDKCIVALYRQYKPEVVITHDVNGEYGHGAHRVCADAAQRCVASAASAAKFSDSASQYGTWQVKKLYLHLYKDGALEMDWDQPLSALNGRTGYETALDAYVWHVSQHEAGQKDPQTGKFEVFTVEPRSSDYSCYRFGLAYSAVGPDTVKNDFFENIPGY